MRTLVLGLGNELLADDAIGILAARALKPRLGRRADVVETSASGLALLELLVGYDRLFVIDSIQTGRHQPGAVFDIDPAGFAPCGNASPHFVGLPEMLEIARHLGLAFPKEVRITAMEVADPLTVGGELSPAVRQALPDLVGHIQTRIASQEAQAPLPVTNKRSE